MIQYNSKEILEEYLMETIKILEKGLTEIKISENRRSQPVKNKYNYNLVFINGTIKDKKGYFVRVDNKTYGPFMKILIDSKKVDGDITLVCMINAVESLLVRIGVNGFELIEKLDYSKDAENFLKKRLKKLDMSEGHEGVNKIANIDKYTIYQTDNKKVFFEFAGEPLKAISSYKMYDSYQELYLDYAVNHDDNTFFDVGRKFSNCSPKIFNQIGTPIKQRQALYEKYGRKSELSSHKDVKILILKLIEELKKNYSMDELWNSPFKVGQNIELFNIKHIYEVDINELIYDYTDKNGQLILELAENKVSSLIDNLVEDSSKYKRIQGIVVLTIGNDVWCYKNREFKKLDINLTEYCSEERVRRVLTDRIKKYNKNVNNDIDAFEKSMTPAEQILVNSYCITYPYQLKTNLDSPKMSDEAIFKFAEMLSNCFIENGERRNIDCAIKQASLYVNNNSVFINAIKKYFNQDRTAEQRSVFNFMIRRQLDNYVNAKNILWREQNNYPCSDTAYMREWAKTFLDNMFCQKTCANINNNTNL